MDEPILDESEKQLVRFCAKWFLEGRQGGGIRIDQFPDYERNQETHTRIVNVANRLVAAGVLRVLNGRGTQALQVEPRCVELVRQWDNPPAPDYRDKLSKWFWSKPWSMAVYFLLVGLPAALGYVVMAKTILEWTGIIKGK